jgi:hypothetical protein
MEFRVKLIFGLAALLGLALAVAWGQVSQAQSRSI